MRVLASPAFSNRGANPYNWLLYVHMAELDLEVHEYSRSRLLTGSYDVWHIHWPEAPLNHSNPFVALRKLVRLLVMMEVARRRGTKIVWTVHNLAAHENQHPRIAPWFWKGFIGRLDGYISLSAAGQRLALERFPQLTHLPGFIVPLGHFRDCYPDGMSAAAARTSLGLEPDATVLSFVGQVRRYKGVADLCEAFRTLPDEQARLVIAGVPRPPNLEDELRRAALRDRRVQLHLGFVPDGNVQLFLKAADLVVLPFRSVLNSASALLALSFDRPVLLPETGALSELQDRVGTDWVLTYRGGITTGILAEAIAWAKATPRPARAPLDSFDWPMLSRQTADVYLALLNRSRLVPAGGGGVVADARQAE